MSFVTGTTFQQISVLVHLRVVKNLKKRHLELCLPQVLCERFVGLAALGEENESILQALNRRGNIALDDACHKHYYRCVVASLKWIIEAISVLKRKRASVRH